MFLGCWVGAHYEMVENVCVGEPRPAEGGGYWIRPLWRLQKAYILGIRVPIRLAVWLGVDYEWHF